MDASNSTYDPKSPSLYWKEVYSDPENLVGIRFTNPTAAIRYVWIEPATYMLELESNTGYKLFKHEKQFTIEYDSDCQFKLWLDYTFGFILYKDNERRIDCELDFDCSDNQFPQGFPISRT